MTIYYGEGDPGTGNSDQNNGQQAAVNKYSPISMGSGIQKLSVHSFNHGKSADASAATATSEHVMGIYSQGLLLNLLQYVPDAALTADDTNYATITLKCRNADGTNPQSLISVTTKSTGGTGSWVAFQPINFGSPSVFELSANQILTLTIAKTGTGVVVPGGTFQIEGVLK